MLDPSLYEGADAALYQGDEHWRALAAEPSPTFSWDPASTYVRRPSYFEDARPGTSFSLEGARCLALLPDFVTTDHISPAGAIAPDSPAAAYLRERGIADAGAPLVVVAGKMYGSGSSRDWAAKGPGLLGVRAVIAQSFERIHRSNLVGMGILPLQFLEGESAQSLGLTGREVFGIDDVSFPPAGPLPVLAQVHAVREDGSEVAFQARVRVDTATEAAYLRAGGILPFVLNSLLDR